MLSRNQPSPRHFAKYYRKLSSIAVLVIACFSPAVPAQSVLTINTQQCVYHSGDDLTWAAPTLDESTWRPYSQWKSDPHQRHLWARCHPDLAPLHSLEHPVIQITLFSAYQLYLNGTLIGAAGNLNNGNFTLNAIRSFAVAPTLSNSPTTIALRITDRNSLSLTTTNSLAGSLTGPLRLRAGEASLLAGIRDSERLGRIIPYSVAALCFGAIGVVSLILLAIYLYDRSRTELLLLSLYCLSLAVFRWSALVSAALIEYPISVFLWIFYGLGQIAAGTIAPVFFFLVARRRIPLVIWIIVAAIILAQFPSFLDALLAAKQPEWLDPFRIAVSEPLTTFSRMAASFAPFFAFLPFSQLPRRIRPLAILCMLWGTADFIFYVARATSLPIPGIPNLFSRWSLVIINIRAFTIAGVLVVLLFLLLREQREVALERALLAGEMHAAGEIQRMLAPAVLDCAPGLQIDVAFHPMREVGGDFYLCRVLTDGTQRIVLGDVSGKGSAAAMTATLLIGAAAARDTDSPAILLANLNRVLLDSRVGGFATCLCADFAADGQVTLANAGHLAPYLHGEEIPIPSGLPLGLTRQQRTYQEINFSLPPGDTLTFLSDGVVEARSATGELFGFDRARSISEYPASKIAEAAQNFGQEDDITVLTLTFAPVGVVHA